MKIERSDKDDYNLHISKTVVSMVYTNKAYPEKPCMRIGGGMLCLGSGDFVATTLAIASGWKHHPDAKVVL